MPHPLPLNPRQGPVASKLLINQLYRIDQEKAQKSTVGAEIERHSGRCSLLEGKLVEMRDTFQRNLSEEGGCYKCPLGTNIHSAKYSFL